MYQQKVITTNASLIGISCKTWHNQVYIVQFSLLWCHNGHYGISNHQSHNCLLNCLFRGRSKKTSKLRVTGLCAGNSPVTGEFPTHRASKGENVSICAVLLLWCIFNIQQWYSNFISFSIHASANHARTPVWWISAKHFQSISNGFIFILH